jgi:hypothetical protein
MTYLQNYEADEDDAVTKPTDDETNAAMMTYGGSFCRALATAYALADTVNRHRLSAAFPDYWSEYEELAAMLKKRSANVPPQ